MSRYTGFATSVRWFLAAAALGVGACGNSDNTSSAPDAVMMGPKTAEASAETKRVLGLTTGYKSWSKFAENQTPKPSVAHEGMFVVAYHNQVVAQALASKTLPLPDGSVIVKENMARPND